MGQAQSDEQGPRAVSREQLSHELAIRFANRCFTQLEIYSFKEVFRSLADVQSDIHYWREETLCRFLEIPDILEVGPVLYQMSTYLAVFPFPSMAPGILTLENMLKVVCIMTERYGKVLKRGDRDRHKLLFRSLAIYDRRMSDEKAGQDRRTVRGVVDEKATGPADQTSKGASGFAIDEAIDDDEGDDDELSLAALDALDSIEVFTQGEKTSVNHSYIPADNFRRLIMLLVVTAPLEAQESISSHVERFTGEKLKGLQRTAHVVLWAFGIENHPGVLYHDFNRVIASSLPYLFDGLNPLFEHLLFNKDFDLAKRKNQDPTRTILQSPQKLGSPIKPHPLLPEEGEILDINILSQLSFFIKGSKLFSRLRPLYSGGDSGFSLGSFANKVIHWRAPTILLVAGSRLPSDHSKRDTRERTFTDSLPPAKFPDGSSGNAANSDRVVFGAYLNVPWKQTHKECFGDAQTLLFQLEPVHDVFRASTISKDYASFTKPPIPHCGVAFGSPAPKAKSTSGLPSHINLGPVSLFLDDALEFGVFTNSNLGGGSFHPSQTRRYDWREEFAIESLEVWGCGGDEEAERQKKAWEFEEREAKSRRNVGLGKDVEADRALLEMAGLIGQHRSGGSV
ncbi:MAG: hypothetical protein M1819_007292 [Sarea resinae]|nr:MAG: hypothetical protein M1819_007292 [Sarea resinae]